MSEVETQEIPVKEETAAESAPVSSPLMSRELERGLRGLFGGSALSNRELVNQVTDVPFADSVVAVEAPAVTPVEEAAANTPLETPDATVVEASDVAKTVTSANEIAGDGAAAAEASVITAVPDQEATAASVKTNSALENVITAVKASASEAGKVPENVITAVETPQASQEAVSTDEVGTSAVGASAGEVDAGLVETPVTAPEVSQDVVSPVDTSGAEKQSVMAESDELKIEWPKMVAAQVDTGEASDNTETATENLGAPSQQTEENISEENPSKSEENSDIEQVSSSGEQQDNEQVVAEVSSEMTSETQAEDTSEQMLTAGFEASETAESEEQTVPENATAQIPVPELASTDDTADYEQAEAEEALLQDVAAVLSEVQETQMSAEQEKIQAKLHDTEDENKKTVDGILNYREKQLEESGKANEKPAIFDVTTGEQVGGDAVEELPEPELPKVGAETTKVSVEDASGKLEDTETPAVVEKLPVQVESNEEATDNGGENEVTSDVAAEAQVAFEDQSESVAAAESELVDTLENVVPTAEVSEEDENYIPLVESIKNENKLQQRQFAAVEVREDLKRDLHVLEIDLRLKQVLLQLEKLEQEEASKRLSINSDEEMAEAA